MIPIAKNATVVHSEFSDILQIKKKKNQHINKTIKSISPNITRLCSPFLGMTAG